MKNETMRLVFAVCIFLAVCPLARAVEDGPARWVDPFIGTDGTGHTFPAACVPFGLVQAGPDTGNGTWAYCSGYRYGDRTICGFTQTHLNGTGCPDLGDLRLMPFPATGFAGSGDTGNPVDPVAAARKICAVAEPGYCAVTLEGGIKVEIAAAEHAALYRITANGRLRLLVDCAYGIGGPGYLKRTTASDVKLVGRRGLVGKNRRRQWVERDYAFAVSFCRDSTSVSELPRAEGIVAPRYLFDFDANDKALLVKVALSAEGGTEAAGCNLAAELPGWDFDAVKMAARAKWNKLLSRATIEGSDDQKKNWYTALYHLFIQPNNLADAGERPFYSTFSCWDTFRAAHPLYTILCPEKVPGMVDSMLEQGRRTGYLPVWTLWGVENQCMIGTHSVPVIVDWFLKECDGSRVDRVAYWKGAYAQIKDALTKRHDGRIKERWDLLDRYGYYPFDEIRGESVSRTMECAYDDWCAGVMAERLGLADDAAFFFSRSQNWKNVFDPSLGLVRGKDSSGKWREPFNPYALGHGAKTDNDFTEGNAFQYSWHVLHDPQGLVAAMGGREKFAARLDLLFAAPSRTEGMGDVSDVTGLIGQYVHGNEPSHHVIYFYPQVGHPEKAAERIREVFDKFYLPKPDGLCGNDDCGQMSAWYLFSAMGFYPFNPCGGEYILGAPQVPKAVLNLAGGKKFTVTARNLSQENKYVRSVKLNGKPVADWTIRHADIMKGGDLVFEMCGGSTGDGGDLWNVRLGIAVDTKLVKEATSGGVPPPADAPYRNPALDVEARIDDLLPRLTDDEKVHLLHATGGLSMGHIPRIGLAVFRTPDAGNGPRAADRPGITYFPAPIAYAASFDTALVREIGRVMGEETRGVYPASLGGNGVARMLLGPGANIARVPVGGRNFEYFGEDPRLSGETAAAWIEGLQSVKVASCMKHYCLNDQECDRTIIDVDCPERALREIYVRPFEIAVQKADPWAFMNSYNKFRGEWTSHSAYLNGILAKECGASGAFIPDWGGVHGMAEAINGGTSIESATKEDAARDKAELQLLAEGKIDRVRFDEAVRRALRLYFRVGAFDRDAQDEQALQTRCEAAFRSAEHQKVARRAAEESFVLVKNDGLLPSDGTRVAIVGPYANVKHAMREGDVHHHQHGGAGAVKAAREITPLEGFRAVFGAENVIADVNAADAARKADLVVYCGGIDHDCDREAPGWGHVEPNDRRDIFLKSEGGRIQEDEIRALAKVNPNLVVALNGGAPLSVEEWHESARAIFVTWYGGEFGGEVLARMVKGEVNPSGRLPYTYGRTLHDWPAIRFGEESYPGFRPFLDDDRSRGEPRQFYHDGIWVGYRGFDRFGTDVRYPFGHGLSYTTWSEEIVAETNDLAADETEIVVRVTNTGARAGRHSVLLWASKPNQPDAKMPPKELVAFESVRLAPRQSADVRFTVGFEELKYWSEAAGAWRLPQGEIIFSVSPPSKACSSAPRPDDVAVFDRALASEEVAKFLLDSNTTTKGEKR